MNQIDNENIIITKVRIKDGRILIRWQDDRDGDRNKYELDSCETPRPEFGKVMGKLAVPVARICEMPETDASLIDVIGVTFSYRDDIMGATITALKHLSTSTSPLVINTPHKPEAPYSGTDDLNCLDEETLMMLADLMSEARRYISGERAQVELFDEEAA